MSSDDLKQQLSAIAMKQPRATIARYGDKRKGTSWLIGVSGKAFAHWELTGEQAGIHLRSNDDALQRDARVTPSTVFPGKHNFVHLTSGAALEVDELERLVAASHALALRKDGGVARGGEFRDLYIPVRKALEAARPPDRPSPPYHAGGPQAKIMRNEGPTAHALAVWAAELIEATIPADEKKAQLHLLKLARATKNPAREIIWAPAYEKGGSPALRAARAACLARASIRGGYDTRASSYAADAAVAVIEQLAGDGGRIRKFISDLDEHTLVAEFIAAAKERGGRPEIAVERVLWRGADATGNCALWLARLTATHYALLGKQGKRWCWTEGSRDDVLATVPDTQFKAASAVALARDLPGFVEPPRAVQR